jgi:hypothetical protein
MNHTWVTEFGAGESDFQSALVRAMIDLTEAGGSAKTASWLQIQDRSTHSAAHKRAPVS